MQAVMTFPNALLRSLRHSLHHFLQRLWQHCLPRFLTTDSHQFDQPLLNQSEILDLRSRVQSRRQNLQAALYDTANQRMGDARSIYRGYGMDYEESRAYQSGDDPRYMNWSLTARTGELHMKVFREERRPGVFIVVDRRASMRFGTRVRLKATQAARAAAVITYAALQRHASVGGVILDFSSPAPHWFKEADDEQDAFALINAAGAACPPTDIVPTSALEPNFDDTLNMLRALLTPGTQLYLISDFIDAGERQRGQLLHLAAENEVHAIHICDPAELHLPDIGSAQFYTAGEQTLLSVDTHSSTVQMQYSAAAENHFADRKQLFHNLGITYTMVSTAEDEIESILTRH
jgi:uncharacterized protein (DUF58 family)